MKKLLLVLLPMVCFCGTLDYTTEQVNDAVGDAFAQLGAAGYSTATNVTVEAGVWTNVPAGFITHYVSGFDYVSGSTITYTNKARAFLFGGSCSSGCNS